jgi:hypothetical protein
MGERRQRPGHHVLCRAISAEPRLHDGFGYLFHKQGQAIGLGHNLRQHRRGQVMPPQHPLNHFLDVRPR